MKTHNKNKTFILRGITKKKKKFSLGNINRTESFYISIIFFFIKQLTFSSSGCEEKHFTMREDCVPFSKREYLLICPSTALMSILKNIYRDI